MTQDQERIPSQRVNVPRVSSLFEETLKSPEIAAGTDWLVELDKSKKEQYGYFNDVVVWNYSDNPVELLPDRDAGRLIPLPALTSIALPFREDNLQFSDFLVRARTNTDTIAKDAIVVRYGRKEFRQFAPQIFSHIQDNNGGG